jgi:hypothetical protein
MGQTAGFAAGHSFSDSLLMSRAVSLPHKLRVILVPGKAR